MILLTCGVIGMTEYIIYLIAVIGVFVLRLRPDSRESGITLASYRMSTVNPVILHCISPLIVGRSAVEHPMNIVAIVADFRGGLLIHRSTQWTENHTGD